MRKNGSKKENLRDSSQAQIQYQRFINQIYNGYSLQEIICNEEGDPVDYRFLEVNPAFERLTGLSSHSVVGRTISEIFPEVDKSWIERYGKVALTGEPDHFEDYNAEINRHFDVTVFSPAYGRFASVLTDITEQRKTKDQLRENQQRFHSYVHNAPYGILVIDRDGKNLDLNPTMADISGYSRSELLSMNVINLLPEESRLSGMSLFNQLKKEGRTSGYLRIFRKDGVMKWWGVNAVELSKDSFLIFVRDVTDEKQAKEILEESADTVRKRLKMITEPGGDPGNLSLKEVVDTDVFQTIMEDFYSLTGMLGAVLDLSGEILVAVGWQDICTKFHRCHPETAKNCRESDTHLSSGVKAGTFKAYKCKNHMWDMVTPIVVGNKHVGNVFFGQFFYEEEAPDEELFREQAQKYGFNEKEYMEALGKVPRFSKEKVETGMRFYARLADLIANMSYQTIAQAKMLTEGKRTAQNLASEKERLAVTLRSIGDGVITTDIEGNIVMLNKVAEKLTGWNSGNAAGKPLSKVFNIIDKKTREKRTNPVERVLSTGEAIELGDDTVLIKKDGSEIQVADSGAPIHDKESRVIGVVLVFRDMTEKYKFDELEQKNQKLESLGVLAGGIAHDFNNLLSSIFGYVELAKEKTDNEKIDRYLTESLDNIDRARALTMQLLTFAKGGAPIKEVDQLFPFITNTVRFALSGSSVTSRFEIADDLWLCEFDKNQIAQVIDNLTINAVQAMPDGGEIIVSAQNISFVQDQHPMLPPGDYIKISLRDQGIGIPKEIQSSIFDPYFTTKEKGQGLGLSSSYSIISRHGGLMDMESEPGKGTVFYIYLPATTELSKTLDQNTWEDHYGEGVFLVMDDEPSIRELLREILESFGYTVVQSSTGEEAVSIFQSDRNKDKRIVGMIFDLTVSGGMGGEAAVKEIRKISSEIPVFVASGYSEDPIIGAPEEYGFNAALIKPFMKNDLSAVLNRFINKNRGTTSEDQKRNYL